MIKVKLVLISALMFIFTATSAQEKKDDNSNEMSPEFKRHEINIGFTNIFSNQDFLWSYYFYEDNYPYYYDNFTNPGFLPNNYGVGYKLHFQKSAIRSSFAIGLNNFSSSFIDEDFSGNSYQTKQTDDMKSKTIEARLGYEFIFGENRTRFFFGIDAIYKQNNFKYVQKRESFYTDPNQPGTISTNEEKNKSDYNGYGGSPVLGLRVYLTEMVSLSTETRLDVIAYQAKRTITSTYDPSFSYGSANEREFSGINTMVNPFGLISVNIHL